jgi:CHAT domain-containing protein
MRRLEAIWNDLAARHPDYVAIRREETIDAASAFALFDDHVSALVEFYLGDQYGTALAFVLVRGETAPRVVRLTVDAGRIAQLVAAVRARTTDVPIAAFRAASKELYDATIAPLIDLIPEGAGICIVPYGQLHNAPFSGLWDGTRYLFERNALTIAASVSALRWWLRKDRGARERCLVFAATSNIREGGKQLVNLDSFADLARRVVAPLFPQAIVVAGADATKQRLLDALVPSDATGPDVAHLACHGIAKPEGFASCLVLAGDDASDAKDLSALEIASGLRIDASLVTLSACHSAVSETSTGGDEVAGLAQAFLMAGASSVLATLWEVRQDAGDSVMREFYERWCAKTGPCESKIASLQAALRIASQSPNALGRLGGLLGLHDDVSHPYLWSTLQLYGNWR